jgi:uncharacterized protein (DUF427 family)
VRQPHHPDPDPVGPGQESVWGYPRPPVAQSTSRHIVIVHKGATLVDTRAAWRTLETSHPPTYYIPQADIAMAHHVPNAGRSICEWKGEAQYWDVIIGGARLVAAGWSYPSPSPGFRGAARPCRFLRRAIRPRRNRRRTGDTTARGVLWRVDHLGRSRTVQGHPGQPLLVKPRSSWHAPQQLGT